MDATEQTLEAVTPFYEQAGVQMETIPVAGGIPFGFAAVPGPAQGLGGAYGSWGRFVDNASLPGLIEQRLGEPLGEATLTNLAELGFVGRQILYDLTPAEQLEIEVTVGARLLQVAAQACGWEPGEVQAALIGVSAPLADDFVTRVAQRAGLSADALTVAIHKACDSSVSGLHLALNPNLPEQTQLGVNLAELLRGRKVLVGGVEGLSRFVGGSHDKNAYQLFGNAAGVIGLIPGETIQFLAGATQEVFDAEGVLQVKMLYPHTGPSGDSMVDARQTGPHSFRVAGLQHEPQGDTTLAMAGPMGMVKLFVRTGVQVVSAAYRAYQQRMAELGTPGHALKTVVVHHANLKINRLKEKNLQKEGIVLAMPWVLSEFGNVSAASNMIAYLRQLPGLQPGDHILFDGFGAGTYYDVLAVKLGE